ncbi:MAG TPA: hypothetical protein VGC18_14435 [Lacisediminihabitans sp.]|uniref:hypothetical protein n=1 Tax=Lacisediminihabitans sp. TaxID=2787631 RepID=UPI002ED96489
MSTERTVYRRVLRRETHSSRAGAAITVAVCLIILLAAAGAGCVFLIMHLPTIAALQGAFQELSRFRPAVRYPVLSGGIVVAVLGVIVLVLGLMPGRKARRRLASERAAVVVDDSVIANAIADRVSSAVGADRRHVRVTVGRRRAAVRIVPTSGVPVSTRAVAEASTAEAAEYGLSRRPRVHVAESGTVS